MTAHIHNTIKRCVYNPKKNMATVRRVPSCFNMKAFPVEKEMAFPVW